MNPLPYNELSYVQILGLCVWREARGEQRDGKRSVAHVILNRSKIGGWWGNSIQAVILKPWQFSSFNLQDPNNTKWPEDTDASGNESLAVAQMVIDGDFDLTSGATYYHDTSMAWPKAWGNQSDYENTLNVGRLKFYKRKSAADLSAEGDV